MNVNFLAKGLKHLGILVLLLIISPIALTMGFKALNKFAGTPQIYIAYSILVLSAVLLIFTVFFAFKTFNILLKALFNNS